MTAEQNEIKSAVCPYCSGVGWTAEHASHPHPDGDCMGMCPIQVQCPHCEATGKVMQEVVDRYNQEVKDLSEKKFNPDDYECLAGVCPDLSDEDHCETCTLKKLKHYEI